MSAVLEACRSERGRSIVALLAMWATGLGGLTLVLQLDQRADKQRRAQLVVASIQRDVEALPGIVFDTQPARPATGRDRLSASEARLRVATLRLHELDPDRSAIPALLDRYFNTVDATLSLVVAGRVEAGGALIARADAPGGTAVRLRTALLLRDAELTRETRHARLLAFGGACVALLALLLAFTAALLRSSRARRRAEALADDNAHLLERTRRDEARYRDLFENAFEPIATVDLEWKIVEANAAFQRALGYTEAELVGTTLNDYLTPEGQEQSALHRDEKLSGQKLATTYEQSFIARDGSEIVFEVSTRLIVEDGEPVGVQGICHDISAHKIYEAELKELAALNRHQALHDGLTALPNRLGFREHVEQTIDEAGDDPFALMVIDLDRFKQINDALGHDSGDLLLYEVAARLRTTLGDRGLVARLGGDEFGVLLSGGSPAGDAWLATVEEIDDVLAQPVLLQGIPVSAEASIGVAFYPSHGSDPDVLLQRADVALYLAKDDGRGHAVYDAAEDTSDSSKLGLLAGLRRAIRERELTLHFQPQTDLRTGRVTSVEALVRWQHPERGLVGPGEFVPLAEQTDLIQPLTRYVLDEAVRQCKEWERSGHVLDLAVNLSARNLAEPELVDDVLHILRRWSLDPNRLLLEVTETATAADPIGSAAMVERLSAHGIRVVVDDFGAGNTSLAYLSRLAVDQLKIDRSFVTNVATDGRDHAIVRSIVTLAHDLGLQVLAEGVETGDVLERLRLLDCDQAQGYHLSRPLPGPDLLRWLAREGGSAVVAA